VATTTSRETASPEETEALGEELGRRLRIGDLVLLSGELGAGKTTFVRGVARGIGSSDSVASPTFQLVRVYRGGIQLAHVDLYRIESSVEMRDLGLDELLDQGAALVEWGERLDDVVRVARIHFDVLGDDRRRLTVVRDLVR